MCIEWQGCCFTTSHYYQILPTPPQNGTRCSFGRILDACVPLVHGRGGMGLTTEGKFLSSLELLPNSCKRRKWIRKIRVTMRQLKPPI